MASSQLTESGRGPRRRDILGRISAAIVYLALVAPPFLFGSRDATTIAAWCAILGVGLMFAPVRRLQKSHLLLLAGLCFVVLCFAIVLHEQLSSRPWIAPFNPIWDKASAVLGQPLVPSVSIVRDEPFYALGLPLANLLALTLGLVVGSDSDRARRCLHVIAWAGVAYALYGILMLLFDPTGLLWREKSAYVGSLTATFINRNTAAAYFGACSVIWLVLLMRAIRRHLPRGPIVWKKVPQRILLKARRSIIIRFIMLFVCLSAMFMTNSRGGVLVSLVAMILAFMVYFARDIGRGMGIVGALAGCVAASFVLLQTLGGNVGARIDLQGLSDAGRLSVYRSTLRIISDNPWFGTGLGTFEYAFPEYRSSDISMRGRWDIAHNTTLQLASEVGLPLTGVVMAAWIVALVILVRAVLMRRRDIAAPLSALAVSLIALLHSSIDFSIQIAGFSIVVFALLGVGLSQAVLEKDGTAEASGRALQAAGKADGEKRVRSR